MVAAKLIPLNSGVEWEPHHLEAEIAAQLDRTGVVALVRAMLQPASTTPKVSTLRGAALREYWISQLSSKAARDVLNVLVGRRGGQVSAHDLAQLTGYLAKSQTFKRALALLRKHELISGSGWLRASETLFD